MSFPRHHERPTPPEVGPSFSTLENSESEPYFFKPATLATIRALSLACTLAFFRGMMRAETGALTVGLDGVAELATIAFLVAFRLLIKDFF